MKLQRFTTHRNLASQPWIHLLLALMGWGLFHYEMSFGHWFSENPKNWITLMVFSLGLVNTVSFFAGMPFVATGGLLLLARAIRWGSLQVFGVRFDGFRRMGKSMIFRSEKSDGRMIFISWRGVRVDIFEKEIISFNGTTDGFTVFKLSHLDRAVKVYTGKNVDLQRMGLALGVGALG